ncbi:hypothetical protein HJC23_011647 [Cyclotella cryptica]|uniref:Phosducin thioredoxin-like domain-containing protein n=1 Tax=Cyclotella cryptica TaxID=29204 RepID=A0ABD3NKJ6_9STRA|eukprot:CCRYP_020678-RA/>CCRYP_020678-RA protein AED:0.35 eAED:0.35 QI:0/-1/0/1/-1/1/1/0/301
MEGRGVTNYSSDKPSYGFSTATTEFDDALISRGIVTFEQAMLAKGASPAEALRLTKLHEKEQETSSRSHVSKKNVDGSLDEQLGERSDTVSDGSTDGDDQEFISKYRQMRLKEMKHEETNPIHAKKYGELIFIARSDWNREVNEASQDGQWVIVNLSRSSSCLSQRHDEMCDKVQEIIVGLADRFEGIKFVSIPSNSAIENWPAENLPTLFCYRFGKLQHQLIGIGAFGGSGVNLERVEWRLAKLGVLETELEEDPKPSNRTSCSTRSNSYTGMTSSAFGGTGCRLATRREDDESDYDNVD